MSNTYPDGPTLAERSGCANPGSGPTPAPRETSPSANAELACLPVVEMKTLHLDLSTPERMDRFERAMTTAYGPPPAAFIREKMGHAVICCYCPTKAEADLWAKARNMPISHSACPKCFEKAMKEAAS
jgi:hypothetical protein